MRYKHLLCRSEWDTNVTTINSDLSWNFKGYLDCHHPSFAPFCYTELLKILLQQNFKTEIVLPICLPFIINQERLWKSSPSEFFQEWSNFQNPAINLFNMQQFRDTNATNIYLGNYNVFNDFLNKDSAVT